LRIRFTETADNDLTAIRSHIAKDNAAAADRTIIRILQSIRYLENFPRLGRPGLLPETRELSISKLPYKAVYRIEGDIILIVTIVHTSRLFP
jgi:toxin ParE1/3/4